MSEARSMTLQEFLRLQNRDQAAIAKHLSQDERRRLLALREKKPPAASRGPRVSDGPDWSVHSPWLAKHLARMVADAESNASKLTPSAQAALHDCLSRSTTGAGS